MKVVFYKNHITQTKVWLILFFQSQIHQNALRDFMCSKWFSIRPFLFPVGYKVINVGWSPKKEVVKMILIKRILRKKRAITLNETLKNPKCLKTF